MHIVKGTFLGIWLFSFSMIAFYFVISRRLPSGPGIVSVDVFTHPALWIAAAVCIGAGILITRSWSPKPILWAVLAVTELFPVGLVVMFLMLAARNREVIEKMAGK